MSGQTLDSGTVDSAAGQVEGTADPEPPRADRRRAVLGAIVIALVFAAAAYAIYRQRHSLADSIRDIGPAAMLASLGLGVLGVACTYPSWRAVLAGLSVRLPWAAGAKVFFTSQLGKYLPGSVWPVLLQMEAGRAHGASRRTMISANLVTLVLSCAVGLLIAAGALPFADTTALHKYWWFLLALPLLLALLHPRAIPWLLDRAFGLLRREPLGERLDARASFVAASWSLASFVLLGLHVAVLALALGGDTTKILLLSVGGMALAVAGGVLFIPAPAGAGVRDVILALVLGAELSSARALAVVIASRVLLILGDIGLAGVAVAIRPRSSALKSA